MKTNFHWKMRFCEGKNSGPSSLHAMIEFIVWLEFSSVEKNTAAVIIFILLIKFFASTRRSLNPLGGVLDKYKKGLENLFDSILSFTEWNTVWLKYCYSVFCPKDSTMTTLPRLIRRAFGEK